MVTELICFFLGIVVIAVTCLVAYFKWIFKYWHREKLPYVKPSIPFGTLGDVFMGKCCFGEAIKKHYRESKRKGLKHVGIFTMSAPGYMPIDLDYIKNILSNDFSYFTDRGFYFNEKHDPLSGNLFMLEGARWKKLRAKLTPTFSSLKLKTMFNIIVECGKHLTDAIEDESSVDVGDVLERYSVDIIGCCAFGIDCNCFEERDSKFQKCGKRIFQQTTWELIRNLFAYSNQGLAKKLKVCTTPNDVVTFFTEIVKNTIQQREKNSVSRGDFLQILIDMKNNPEHHLTLAEVTAQVFVFFLAGFETSSSTISFCLYELAQNHKIQDRLRAEIRTTLKRHNEELTYEAVKDMPYLEQVIDETLRKYPPLPVLNRQCVTDYKVPGAELTLKKGTPVMIPVYGLQHDLAYFANPEVFDPERFIEQNKLQIKPFSYMPFGKGPRACVGVRFGLLQVKVAVIVLINKYQLFLNKKTKRPLRMSPYNYLLSPLEPIWLDIKKHS